MDTPVGVLGCGSFGLTVATLLAHNSKVLMYCRNPRVAHGYQYQSYTLRI